jgi:hypothetical protein
MDAITNELVAGVAPSVIDGVADVTVPSWLCATVVPLDTSITCIIALVVPGEPKPVNVTVPVPAEPVIFAHAILIFTLALVA